MSVLARPFCPTRPVLALLFASLLIAGTPNQAAAFFDLFGLFGGDEEEAAEVSPDAHPYKIELELVGAQSEQSDLETRLQGASQLYAQRERIPPSTAALLARARDDYARILAALYADGRYGGTVTITLDGKQADALAPDAALSRPADVKVRVDPGPVFTFGEIAIDREPPLEPGRNDHLDGPDKAGLVAGERARSRIVLSAEEALVAQWRALGHAKAEIAQRRVVANHDTRTVDVALSVAPGPPAVYGHVEVTGTDRMDADFVRRQTVLYEGDSFHPRDIELANDQLRRLQVFQAARIAEGDEIGPGGRLPMTVNVVERLPREFGIGGALSTLDGASAEAYWQHRNLFGQAERLRVEGRVGGIGTGSFEDADSYNYFAGVTYTKPGVLTPFTDLTAHVSAKLENLDTYRDRSVTARIGLAHRFTRQLSGEVAAQAERARIEDPLGERDFTLVSLPARLVYDTRENEMNPDQGMRLMLSGEPFHEFEFGNTGVIGEFEASAYRGLDAEGRFVLAGRVAMGATVGAPRDEMPASRLFFTGGGGTVRGYSYRSIGPRLASGEVVGGRSYFAASAELRAAITDQIGIVPFVDVGSAYESSFPDFSEELRVGAGLGLRYNTGIGPIRFDVAVPVNPRPGDPTVAFYAGIGQAF